MAGKQYEPMIDVARAAEMMGISTQEVRALVRSRQLSAITFPGTGGARTYRFRPTDVDRAIRRIHNAKGFSEPYAQGVWRPPPPPRPTPRTGRRGRPHIVFDVAHAEELRKAGVTLIEIGRHFGVSSTTVANALRSGRREILQGPGRRSVEFDLEKAVAMRREGKTFAEIAAGLGVSAATVSKAVHEAAPELQRTPAIRDRDTLARMVTMRREGASYREIGEAFGLRADAVARGFKTFGIPSTPVHRGARRKQIDIPRALEMRREGKTYAQIASEFGLNTATVARAIRENSGLKGSMFAFDIKKAMEMRRQGCGYVEIAKAVGVSRPTVTNAIKIRMLSEPVRRFHLRFDLDKAIAMRRERKSFQAIGAALGVSAQTVASHLKRHGLGASVRSGPHFDLDMARHLRSEGVTLREIASRCGVSIQTIAHYLGPRVKRKKANAPGEPSPPDAAEAPEAAS